MSEFAKNLKFHIEKNNYNTVSLSEKMGVSAGAVGFWQNGARFPKNAETIEKLLSLLKVTAIDLFSNPKENREKIVKEELKYNLDRYIDQLPSTLLPASLKLIPVTKGYPSSLTNNIVQEDSMHYVSHIYIDKRMVQTAYQDKELRAVEMIGNAMTPYLAHGDVAIYHPTTTPMGDGTYVIETPHGLEVKNLIFLRSGAIRTVTINPSFNSYGEYADEYPPEERDTLEIYGIVVGRIMKS